jgi:hypothetical protein
MVVTNASADSATCLALEEAGVRVARVAPALANG